MTECTLHCGTWIMQGISLLYAVKEEGLRLIKFYQFITAWCHSSLVAIVCSKRVNICAKILPVQLQSPPSCLQSSYGADSVYGRDMSLQSVSARALTDRKKSKRYLWPISKLIFFLSIIKSCTGMKPSTYEDSYTGGGASINHRQQLYREGGPPSTTGNLLTWSLNK